MNRTLFGQEQLTLWHLYDETRRNIILSRRMQLRSDRISNIWQKERAAIIEWASKFFLKKKAEFSGEINLKGIEKAEFIPF